MSSNILLTLGIRWLFRVQHAVIGIMTLSAFSCRSREPNHMIAFQNRSIVELPKPKPHRLYGRPLFIAVLIDRRMNSGAQEWIFLLSWERCWCADDAGLRGHQRYPGDTNLTALTNSFTCPGRRCCLNLNVHSLRCVTCPEIAMAKISLSSFSSLSACCLKYV